MEDRKKWKAERKNGMMRHKNTKGDHMCHVEGK